jgi:hypothetical protein
MVHSVNRLLVLVVMGTRALNLEGLMAPHEHGNCVVLEPIKI